MTGKIGIALAAYKPDLGHFFEQLTSIQSQTWSNWVCCICVDSSLSPIRGDSRFASIFEDPRFHWTENTTQLGHLKNFEKAIQSVVALGVTAVACCDQDDIWFPEKLKVSAHELKVVGRMGLVFCDMKLMDASGKVSEQTAWEVERRGVDHHGTFDLLVRNVVPGTGMLMDAELAKKFPVIPANALYHDHWYPLVASRIGRVYPIKRPLYAYRIHEANVAGLSPYTGLFAQKANEKASKKGLIEKCRKVWMRSFELAQAAEEMGLRLTRIERAAFLRKWDLGVLLWVRGLLVLWKDPALTRACWSRAIGKILG
jgi:hypothetical protein